MIIKENPEYSMAPLSGLILAGGKSVRMGQDKGMIKWHGKEQRYYMADLLSSFCNIVCISCREDQAEEITKPYTALKDTYPGLGPMSGILTALASAPDHAWLVTACDLPLLDHATLDFLIKHRDPSCMATTFQSPHDQLPEPLITIWEPHSFPVLFEFMNKGIKCPRKVLINSNIRLLTAPAPERLMNVNRPEELETAKAFLESKQEDVNMKRVKL